MELGRELGGMLGCIEGLGDGYKVAVGAAVGCSGVKAKLLYSTLAFDRSQLQVVEAPPSSHLSLVPQRLIVITKPAL